jgi:hypothetical protein
VAAGSQVGDTDSGITSFIDRDAGQICRREIGAVQPGQVGAKVAVDPSPGGGDRVLRNRRGCPCHPLKDHVRGVDQAAAVIEVHQRGGADPKLSNDRDHVRFFPQVCDEVRFGARDPQNQVLAEEVDVVGHALSWGLHEVGGCCQVVALRDQLES